MSQTAIEWSDYSWNPVTGCTRVSAGCDHCYAATQANGPRLRERYLSKLPVVDTAGNRADPFAVRVWPDRLTHPEKWRKPQLIFVNSMSDLFHVDVPEAFVRECFAVMVANDHHIYQVLTKRPGRALRFVEKNADLFPDGRLPWWIWIGTSIENQEAAYRVGQLARIPAEVRFLSCEPLLGALNIRGDLMQGHAPGHCAACGRGHGFTRCPNTGGVAQVRRASENGPVLCAEFRRAEFSIAWVIAGGESGRGFRAPDPAGLRSLRDQCSAAGVPFLFKQWGGLIPKSGGRLLDGVQHDGYPAHPMVQAWMAARAGGGR